MLKLQTIIFNIFHRPKTLLKKAQWGDSNEGIQMKGFKRRNSNEEIQMKEFKRENSNERTQTGELKWWASNGSPIKNPKKNSDGYLQWRIQIEDIQMKSFIYEAYMESNL